MSFLRWEIYGESAAAHNSAIPISCIACKHIRNHSPENELPGRLVQQLSPESSPLDSPTIMIIKIFPQEFLSPWFPFNLIYFSFEFEDIKNLQGKTLCLNDANFDGNEADLCTNWYCSMEEISSETINIIISWWNPPAKLLKSIVCCGWGKPTPLGALQVFSGAQQTRFDTSKHLLRILICLFAQNSSRLSVAERGHCPRIEFPTAN